MNKVKLLAFLAVFWAAGSAWAGPGSLGDDDPYPLVCADISGEWRSDDFKETLVIQQQKCRWLSIRSILGPKEQATTIVPDDKARSISGAQWTGQVRYRWNSRANATTLEAFRELHYADREVIEVVHLERARGQDILLESTYRTIVMGSKECRQGTGQDNCSPHQEPVREYMQRVFRRIK